MTPARLPAPVWTAGWHGDFANNIPWFRMYAGFRRAFRVHAGALGDSVHELPPLAQGEADDVHGAGRISPRRLPVCRVVARGAIHPITFVS